MQSRALIAIGLAVAVVGIVRLDAPAGPPRQTSCAPIVAAEVDGHMSQGFSGSAMVGTGHEAGQEAEADGSRRGAAAYPTRRGAAGHPAEPTRFLAIDITIDSGEAALGAYQFEYIGAGEGVTVKLVGVEGGEAAPFAAAPRYDPRALAGGRVIVGDFSTAAGLPRGELRVARLHLAVEAVDPERAAEGVRHEVKLMTAGDGAGARIDATIRYQEVEAP